MASKQRMIITPEQLNGGWYSFDPNSIPNIVRHDYSVAVKRSDGNYEVDAPSAPSPGVTSQSNSITTPTDIDGMLEQCPHCHGYHSGRCHRSPARDYDFHGNPPNLPGEQEIFWRGGERWIHAKGKDTRLLELSPYHEQRWRAEHPDQPATARPELDKDEGGTR